MKKIAGVLAAVALTSTVLLSSGCNNLKNEKSLYDQGVQVVSLMKEMTENEDYLNAVTGSAVLKGQLSDAGAEDPGKPKAVYQISIGEDKLTQYFQLDQVEKASEAMKAYLRAKSYCTIAPQINAAEGTQELAAASACTVSQSFVCSNFTGDVLYLYLYEDAAPVMIAFSSGPEQIVTATGSYLLVKDFAPESKEEVASIFGDLSVEVTQVQP